MPRRRVRKHDAKEDEMNTLKKIVPAWEREVSSGHVTLFGTRARRQAQP
jgi:hypothetical protein